MKWGTFYNSYLVTLAIFGKLERRKYTCHSEQGLIYPSSSLQFVLSLLILFLTNVSKLLSIDCLTWMIIKSNIVSVRVIPSGFKCYTRFKLAPNCNLIVETWTILKSNFVSVRVIPSGFKLK